MPSNWLVFDRIRALTRQHNIYQAERVLQNQSQLDRLTAGAEFLDGNNQAAILDQTNLQINRLERYKDYEQMDQMGEISLALDLYADEACLTGDTRVPLLDGSCPTIAELAEKGGEYWVYSFDQKGNQYVPALANNARITGYNVPIIRVTLDDGSAIRCTSDHLFMLSNNSFIEAGKLSPGDNLKPLYEKTRYLIYHQDCRPDACPRRYLNKSFGNHSVIKVEQCGIADKVYDLNVPDYHCFAAGSQSSWVIVHNSLVDPEKKHTLVIRARNRRLKKELESLFFDTLLWDNYCRPAIRYLCKYGDMPFEIIPTIDRTGVASLRFMDVYNFTRIETRYGDLVGFFHQDDLYPNPQFMHPWQVMHWRLTSFENIYHPYGRCCVWGTKIATPQGLQNIEDLREDEEVYAFDGKQIIPTKIKATCNSGQKQILRIATRHCATKCSQNHPLLVRKWIKRSRDFGDKWLSELAYKRADELSVGDELVVSSKYIRDRFGAEDNTTEYLPDQDITFETVISIEDVGIQETADIQVEHAASNFVADGIVVHNSVLDGGRKAFKQLRLMEDAALIYRITRAPEKRKFTIPVGLIPPKEVPEYMQMVARQFKRQRFYNPTTGAFDERYSPLIQEDDFFLPRRPDGVGPDVDTLPGAENLDQIADIEYFKKKMISPTKIPFARVGIGEGAGEASEKSLSQSHAEFAKAVQWIQREAATGLAKIAIVHLALKGYNIDDLKGFDIALTATSAMEELYRIETWQTRAGVMADLNDLGWFPKEWIVTHFTDLAPDEIEELKEMEQTESEGGPGGGMPGGLDIGGPGGEFDVGGEEGEEEGEEELGMGLDLEPEEAGAAEDIGMEGLDRESQRRLLNEMKSQDDRKALRRLVNNWAQKLGKPLAREDTEYNSGYTHMIESKELDGLSKTTPDEERGQLIAGDLQIYDPNRDGENLLVEWSVDEKVRSEVIRETYELIMDSQEDEFDESDEITDDDVQLLQEGA